MLIDSALDYNNTKKTQIVSNINCFSKYKKLKIQK